jgi:hypothetical protein
MIDYTRAPRSFVTKVGLVLHTWRWFIVVRSRIGREPTPVLVASIGRPAHVRAYRQPPARLSRIVNRSLRLGSWHPTCLVSAIVLYRLLREQGDPAEVVIGLPEDAADHDAHAWVELGGRDVGPPPGRGKHVAMARFG